MYKKAQSAIEFMILIGAVLLFFTTFLIAIQIQNTDKIKEQRSNHLKEIARTIQNEISLAVSSYNGYQRAFILPEQILDLPYNASLQSKSVYVYTLNNKHALALPVANVTGQLIIGANTIRKINNSVFLNA